MTARSALLLLLFSASYRGGRLVEAQSHKAQAWQNLGLKYTFPETDYPDITDKPNAGITFSGGGDRSFIASIGYLAAFHELGECVSAHRINAFLFPAFVPLPRPHPYHDLTCCLSDYDVGFMDSVRYILGSSGGSWATVVYTYYQHEDIPDSVMLGPVVFPEHISLEGLGEMAPGCVRAYTNTTYQVMGVLFSDWMDAVQVCAIYILCFINLMLRLLFLLL